MSHDSINVGRIAYGSWAATGWRTTEPLCLAQGEQTQRCAGTAPPEPASSHTSVGGPCVTSPQPLHQGERGMRAGTGATAARLVLWSGLGGAQLKDGAGLGRDV